MRGRRWLGWLGLVVCVGLCIIPAKQARAAACCASAAAFGVGRLLKWEMFAVGLQTSLTYNVGQWNPKGNWLGFREDYTDISWQSELWGLVRIVRPLSFYARLPWMLNYKRSADLDAIGGGFGDIQAGLRWDIIQVGQFKKAPALALIVNVLMPTGRRTNNDLSPLGAEITGRGAWVLSSALSLELTRTVWFGQLNFGVQVPLPFERDDLKQTQRFGVGVLGNIANGFELIPETLVLTLVLRFLWEDNLELGGRSVALSARLDLGATLALSWRFDPHWTLQLSFDSGIFASSLGRNQNGRLITTLGVRYGFF